MCKKIPAAITKELRALDLNLIGKRVWAKLVNIWPAAIEARMKTASTQLY
jgi:hypothetical protein